jgi:hypothetical protein
MIITSFTNNLTQHLNITLLSFLCHCAVPSMFFIRYRKIVKYRYYIHRVCPFVHPQWTDFHETWCLEFFDNLEKIQVLLKTDKKAGTLQETYVHL